MPLLTYSPSYQQGALGNGFFEGDFKGCFDNLSHHHIMDCLEGFPAKGTISKWLNAGYIDNGSFNDTYSGTPQGGLCKA